MFKKKEEQYVMVGFSSKYIKVNESNILSKINKGW